jgi:alpha-tubulin suppressor-like RCC1 family protein
VAVGGALMFTQLSVGETHTCGVTSGGAAYCWGDNMNGQLGTNAQGDSWTPAPLAGGLTFATVSAGFDHTCALTEVGAAYCWGANNVGQLGNGTRTDARAPAPVSGGLVFAVPAVADPSGPSHAVR